MNDEPSKTLGCRIAGLRAEPLDVALDVDLDTHMLLAEEPFEGGFLQDGPVLELGHAPGLGVVRR